jgi:hypothetical protein
MADHGTVTAVPADPVYEVTNYGLAGTGTPALTVPTTGQIWPRGNP